MIVERLESREVPATFVPSDLGGRVFVDCDLDGHFDDDDDHGVAGVTITLTGTNVFQQSVSLVTTTGSSGAYSFNFLQPGKYTITETQPSGLLDGPDQLGAVVSGSGTPAPVINNGTVQNDRFVDIVLAGGDLHGHNYNFIEYQKNSLSGTVFLDLNDNGIQDAGESGIAGAKLVLTGQNDLGAAVNLTVTSGADGGYSFESLRPGLYSITETTPSGFADGKDAVGTVNGKLNGQLDGNDHVVNISLDGCHSGVGYNFGEKKPPTSSIAGFVFVDCDQDGIFDGDEEPLAGVTVTLDSPQSGTVTTTTAADGSYKFENLAPGTYNIHEVFDEGAAGLFDGKDTLGTPFTGTVADDAFLNVVIPDGPGQAGANYNFGELQPSSLAGTVFIDDNGNGVQDSGEAGLPGVTLALAGVNDLGQNVSIQVTSGTAGDYSFGNLRPGNYIIIEVEPPNFQSTKNTAGTVSRPNHGPGTTRGTVIGDAIININLAGCESGVHFDFGEKPCDCPPDVLHRISGAVFVDCNNNGVRDAGEEGIANAIVVLTGTEAATSATVSIVTATDTNGFYQFVNLRPGNYTLAEVQPAIFLDGKDSAGTPFGGIAGTAAGQDVISQIIIPTNATPLTGVNYNFGEVNSSIAGQIYEDLNDNGVRDAGENLITAAVTVTLTGTDDTGTPVTRTIVTTTGEYLFDHLRPGVYSLHESQPAGYDDGKDRPGNPTNGTVQEPDQIVNISLDGCTNGVGFDFGEKRVGKNSISGFVFQDCDNDGVRDGDESGIAGVTVTLARVDAGVPTIVGITATDGVGHYQFSDLLPAEYVLIETQAAGFLDGADSPGTPFGGISGAIGQDTISQIIIPSGSFGVAGVDYNFGEVQGSLSGLVYQDVNDNGVFDIGELPIAGATITLTGVNDLGALVTLSTTTDAGGKYIFSNLRPGQYSLAETQPAGFFDGKDTLGFDAAHGALGKLGGNDLMTSIDVAGCTSGVNFNFGECPPASVSGFVYQDLGVGGKGTAGFDNGIREANEAGLSGVTITLTGVDADGQSVSLTTTTGTVPGQDKGYYEFKNLAHGTYSITETQPLGFTDGKDTPGTPLGSNANVNDTIASIVLTCGFTGQNNNFGELTGNVAGTGKANISGNVYVDSNRNLVLDATETGRIANVRMFLFRADDLATPIRSTTTDAHGHYEFLDLPNASNGGQFVIVEQQPAAWQEGGVNPGTPFGGVAVPGAAPGTSGTFQDRIELIIVPPVPDDTTLNGIDYNFGEWVPPSKRRFLASFNPSAVA